MALVTDSYQSIWNCFKRTESSLGMTIKSTLGAGVGVEKGEKNCRLLSPHHYKLRGPPPPYIWNEEGRPKLLMKGVKLHLRRRLPISTILRDDKGRWTVYWPACKHPLLQIYKNTVSLKLVLCITVVYIVKSFWLRLYSFSFLSD